MQRFFIFTVIIFLLNVFFVPDFSFSDVLKDKIICIDPGIPSKKSINNPLVVAKSREAGEIILKKVLEVTNAYDLGIIERDDLSGFNWSEIPVVLIETGFLSNGEDDKLLNSKSYQYKLAKGIYNGLVEYFTE